MRAPRLNQSVLGVAAAIEAVTGLVLIVVPHVLIRLLFGAEAMGVSVVIGRVAGIALLALGLGCWMGRDEADGRIWALFALLTYNFLLAIYLALVGLGTELVGVLLWPVVIVHAVLTALLGYAWSKER